MMQHFRNIVFACLLSVWLPVTAHPVHEQTQPAISTVTTTAPYPHADELWLIGSFLVSLTGLVILVRFLRH